MKKLADHNDMKFHTHAFQLYQLFKGRSLHESAVSPAHHHHYHHDFSSLLNHLGPSFFISIHQVSSSLPPGMSTVLEDAVFFNYDFLFSWSFLCDYDRTILQTNDSLMFTEAHIHFSCFHPGSCFSLSRNLTVWSFHFSYRHRVLSSSHSIPFLTFLFNANLQVRNVFVCYSNPLAMMKTEFFLTLSGCGRQTDEILPLPPSPLFTSRNG